jgi:predicted ATPase
VLLDRRSERELLDRLVADVRAGESRPLVVRGEAGIGKTAVLEYVVEHVAGWRVLRVVGIEAVAVSTRLGPGGTV